MGLSFLSLLYLQVSYIEEMVKMRRSQFEENVTAVWERLCITWNWLKRKNIWRKMWQRRNVRHCCPDNTRKRTMQARMW